MRISQHTQSANSVWLIPNPYSVHSTQHTYMNAPLHTRSEDNFSDLLYLNHYNVQAQLSSNLLPSFYHLDQQMLLLLENTPVSKRARYCLKCHIYSERHSSKTSNINFCFRHKNTQTKKVKLSL